jgi:hypothetical protein
MPLPDWGFAAPHGNPIWRDPTGDWVRAIEMWSVRRGEGREQWVCEGPWWEERRRGSDVACQRNGGGGGGSRGRDSRGCVYES